MAKLEIQQFPCLSDNFGVLIHDAAANLTASIDAPDAAAVARALAAQGWRLTHILTTHHHADHTGGNLALKAETGCKIIGPRGEAGKIPGIDQAVGEGDTVQFGACELNVIDTPGHTAGHVTVTSAGTQPASGLHPHTVRVLADEFGIDVSGQRPRPLHAVARQRFDQVITLCDKARESRLDVTFQPRRAHWSMPAPAATGTADRDYAVWRELAHAIDLRVRHHLPTLDPTAL